MKKTSEELEGKVKELEESLLGLTGEHQKMKALQRETIEKHLQVMIKKDVQLKSYRT